MSTLLNQPAGKDLGVFDAFIKSKAGAVSRVAARHLNPERILRIVAMSVSRTPALRNCTIGSILRSVMQSAELGLEPGSATGEAYLVPYGTECTLIPGYRGLIALAFRSGLVLSVRANVVFGGDKFTYVDGLHPVLQHEPSLEREPGAQATHVYCVVSLKDGGFLYDVMTVPEVELIRSKSKVRNGGPWVEHWAEMAKKTVVRRCLKYAPISVEMSKVMAMEEAIETTGTSKAADAEFDYGDMDFGGEEAPKQTKAQKLADQLPDVPPADQDGVVIQQPPLA